MAQHRVVDLELSSTGSRFKMPANMFCCMQRLSPLRLASWLSRPTTRASSVTSLLRSTPLVKSSPTACPSLQSFKPFPTFVTLLMGLLTWTWVLSAPTTF